MVDILANASRLRSGISCSFAREEPRAGGSHRVFKIIFEDSVVWAARENIDPELWETDLKGIKKLQYIRQQRPSLQAPDIFVVEEDRIMYLDWVKGKPLSVWNLQIPRSSRHQFLDGFADFLLQLWTIEAPPEFVTDTKDSYAAWLTKSLDRGLRRTLNKTARWGNAVDYLIMRSMIPDYASKFDNYTEFGFSHGDMNAYNILRAENLELTGVIDWDWAFVAPLPAVVHHPWFLADVPGWNNDGVSSHDHFTQDRAYLENKIAEGENSRRMTPKVSVLLRDSGVRLFFQSAFHFKGIHERFVAMHCQRTQKNLEAAKTQLDIVMQTHPDLKQAALELMEEMSVSSCEKVMDRN